MKKLFLLLGIFLAGCAGVAQQPYQMTTQYNDADFFNWKGNGAATLTGQAFLRTVGGDVRTCAGSVVNLLPATPYNDELISVVSRNIYQPIVGRSTAADKFVRSVTCDAQGKFTFKNLPSRTWYIWTTVEWGVPGSYGVENQGGDLIMRVNLVDGGNNVILTGNNLVD